MSVKIDKYVQIVDESGLIGWIRDESNEKVIIKINMDSVEHTQQMLTLCLDALNTGDFETVEEDDSGNNTGDITNSDNGGLHTGDNSSNEGLTPIDESEGNNGAVEPDVNNDIGSDTGDTDSNDGDLNNG